MNKGGSDEKTQEKPPSQSNHTTPNHTTPNNDAAPKRLAASENSKDSAIMNYVNRRISAASNNTISTFSSMAKQAETLMNGSNSIIFNSYNNNAIFKASQMSIDECVAVDILKLNIR